MNVVYYPHMKSILPIIFVVLVLTGAITYSLAKRVTPKKEVNNFGIAANQLDSASTLSTPTPSKKVTFGTINITPAATVTPTVTPATKLDIEPTISEKSETKGGVKIATETKQVKTTVCTPVYGSANTCTEHVVVDTGAETAIFFNLAGLAYIGGLVSFVKAKTLKR